MNIKGDMSGEEDASYVWCRATIQSRAWCLSLPSTPSSSSTSAIVAVIPFLSLANHCDDERRTCSVALGNGITAPSSSVVMRSKAKIYPEQAIHLSYGDLSFQQKILSFGWVDHEADKDEKAFAITPVKLRREGGGGEEKEIEIKSKTAGLSIEAYKKGGKSFQKEMYLRNKKELNDAVRKVEDFMHLSKSQATQYLYETLAKQLNDLQQALGLLDPLTKKDVLLVEKKEEEDGTLRAAGFYSVRENLSEKQATAAFILTVELNALISLVLGLKYSLP